MALDHSRLGLESKSGRIFLRLTTLLYKILLTNLGACKPSFYTFYTSHLRWNRAMRRCFCHADLGQNAAFHNFEILIMYTKKLLNSDWLRKECSFSVTRVQITNGFWLAENTKETTKNQSDKSCFNNKIEENGHGFQQTTTGFNFVHKTTIEKLKKYSKNPNTVEKYLFLA